MPVSASVLDISPAFAVHRAQNRVRARYLCAMFALFATSVAGCSSGGGDVVETLTPTQMAFNGGSSSGTVATAVASPPSVIVRDKSDRPVKGVIVTFTITAGNGTLTGASPSTNASGIATVGGWTLGNAAGGNTLSASFGSLPSVTINANAVAAAPTQVAPSGGSNSGTAGAPVPTPPSVVVRDSYNNLVNGATVTFQVTAGGGSITGAVQNTSALGVATVGSWTLGTAGTNTLSATVSGSTAAPVTIAATAIASGPDYILTTMTAPGTGTIGGLINVLATSRNQGASTGGPFRVGFYYSTDANVTTNDFYSGYACSFESSLPANTSIDCTGAIGVPSTLPPGTYFVGAVADDNNDVNETNETNNARAAATNTALAPPVRPDLVVDAVTAPAAGTVGSTIALLATVRNSGTAATGSFRLGFYISNDQTITAADTYFANCNYNTGLNAGSASDCSGPIPIPASIASGTYYIGVIADDLGTVTEISETNNTRASSAIVISAVSKPDFVIETMTAAATGTVNGTVSITSRVKNQGGSDAGPFRIGYYYSTDATITTADVFSGTVCEYTEGLDSNTPDDCTGAIAVPATLAPGTYYVGAIADDLAQVSESNETNNARAAAATTVIGGGGTALDLLIDGMYITQSTQTYTGAVPLVANRGGLLRVFVKATQANTLTPTVRARFYVNGTLVDTKTITAPTASVPTAITEGTLASSWNVDVTGLIQPGLSVLVDVDPTNVITESNENDNTFPLSGTAKAMDVRTVAQYNVTLVPVVQVPNGLRGDVTEANKGTYMDFAQRVYPLAATNALVHAPYNYATVISGNYDASWNTLLNEIQALRAAEGSPRRYYGVIKPAYTFGGSGLGFIDGNAAIGIDWSGSVTGTNTSTRSMTAAHEWGHNFGRLHVNCGDPASPDPMYPYASNSIGVFGYDITRNAQLAPSGTAFADLLTYCSPLWISDYTYKAVLTYRASHPQSINAGESKRGLLIWGRIDASGVTLEPAFEVDAPALLPERTGQYTVRATDDLGQELFSLSFDGDAVDHLPGVRQFAYVVPLPAASIKAASVQLMGNGRQAMQRSPAPALRDGNAASLAGTVRLRAGIGSRSILEWDNTRYPMVLVRDPVTKEVLSFARGGRTELAVTSRNLDLTLSDGVGSVHLTITRTP